MPLAENWFWLTRKRSWRAARDKVRSETARGKNALETLRGEIVWRTDHEKARAREGSPRRLLRLENVRHRTARLSIDLILGTALRFRGPLRRPSPTFWLASGNAFEISDGVIYHRKLFAKLSDDIGYVGSGASFLRIVVSAVWYGVEPGENRSGSETRISRGSPQPQLSASLHSVTVCQHQKRVCSVFRHRTVHR